MENKIPHVIYYFWDNSKKPLTPLGQKCLASWKQFFPDYQIIQINETNFDLSCNNFVRVMMRDKAYSYVVDYIRLKYIYDHGGIYFDTDVEIVKDMRPLVDKGPFFALSSRNGKTGMVAMGLGFGCKKGSKILKDLMKNYENYNYSSFLNDKNFPTIGPCIEENESWFLDLGVQNKNELQHINDYHIYPSSFFEPMCFSDRVIRMNSNTVAIHHYTAKSNMKNVDDWIYQYQAKINSKRKTNISEKQLRWKMAFYHPFKAIQYALKHKLIFK